MAAEKHGPHGYVACCIKDCKWRACQQLRYLTSQATPSIDKVSKDVLPAVVLGVWMNRAMLAGAARALDAKDLLYNIVFLESVPFDADIMKTIVELVITAISRIFCGAPTSPAVVFSVPVAMLSLIVRKAYMHKQQEAFMRDIAPIMVLWSYADALMEICKTGPLVYMLVGHFARGYNGDVVDMTESPENIALQITSATKPLNYASLLPVLVSDRNSAWSKAIHEHFVAAEWACDANRALAQFFMAESKKRAREDDGPLPAAKRQK